MPSSTSEGPFNEEMVYHGIVLGKRRWCLDGHVSIGEVPRLCVEALSHKKI